MMRTRSLRVSAAIGMVAMVLTACGSDKKSTDTTAVAADTTAPAGADTTAAPAADTTAAPAADTTVAAGGATTVAAGAAADTTVAAAATGDMKKVSLQLQWVTQAQFAGYFAALDQGFYKAEGLDVTIKEGGVDIVPQTELATGNVDYAIAWVPKALASREQGAGITDHCCANAMHNSSARCEPCHELV